MSLRTCSGLNAATELKVGRIDATKAGPSGVPQAFTVCRTSRRPQLSANVFYRI